MVSPMGQGLRPMMAESPPREQTERLAQSAAGGMPLPLDYLELRVPSPLDYLELGRFDDGLARVAWD